MEHRADSGEVVRRAIVTAEPEVQVFAALGDAVRSKLVWTLANQGPASTTALSAPLEISRQAVDKHLRVLRQVGVVSSTRVGRETRHQVERAALTRASAWIDAISREWDTQLELIKNAAEQVNRD
jgi:DNA-binding transcriptional ArsR family regulator